MKTSCESYSLLPYYLLQFSEKLEKHQTLYFKHLLNEASFENKTLLQRNVIIISF